MRYLLLVSGLFLFTTITPTFSQQDSILMFVSFDSTYYSEYIVMREALEAMGYYVDVRSADIGMAHTYLIGGNLTAQANGLSGSNYSAFESQYQSMVGSPWNAALNTDPGVINITDSIQSISSMASYKALVIVGGKGVVRYRLDGQYSSQLSLPASRVQSAAHKLNDLATEALLLGKPVMGQCHGASIPAFWRVPNTEGSGFDNLGLSLLEGSMATGYPEPETATNLMDLNINFRSEDKVVIGTPSNSFMDNDAGTFRVITTRDWYPQTVVHAAKTLTNVIETYPLTSELTTAVSVLIIHGGAVDTDNCSAGNRNNDVPCNYGNDAANLPADYTDLVALFNSNEFNDNFNFVVSDVDISNNPPFDLNNETEILNYLKSFDVLFFYKHWSDFVSVDLQNAIVTFADDGGGVVSIHHGLYNDIHNGFDKNIMVNDLFEAESPQSGWSATRDTFQILQT
ncbi:MAG: hypothetical protein KDC53_10005, partial [Saprospiraceae bacterium]|nr:hypothetical protein [Saprospiraceae bacterium]